jgi:hypothetical protein
MKAFFGWTREVIAVLLLAAVFPPQMADADGKAGNF